MDDPVDEPMDALSKEDLARLQLLDEREDCIPDATADEEARNACRNRWLEFSLEYRLVYIQRLSTAIESTSSADVLEPCITCLDILQAYQADAGEPLCAAAVTTDPASKDGGGPKKTDPASLAFHAAFPHGYIRMYTSSDQYRCGLYAIRQSLQYQMPDITDLPTIEDLVEILESAEAEGHLAAIPDDADVAKEGISQEQLGNILHIWGTNNGHNLAFGHTTTRPDPAGGKNLITCTFIPTAGDNLPTSRRLWAHMNIPKSYKGREKMPHWSAIKASPPNKFDMTPDQVKNILNSAAAVSVQSQGPSYYELSNKIAETQTSSVKSLDAAAQFRSAFPDGIRIIQVEGDGLAQSLESTRLGIQLNHPGLTIPTAEELRNMLCHYHVRPMLESVSLASLDRISDAVLGAILHYWGLNHGVNLQLGVVTSSGKSGPPFNLRLIPTSLLSAIGAVVVWIYGTQDPDEVWSAVVSQANLGSLSADLVARLVPETDKAKKKKATLAAVAKKDVPAAPKKAGEKHDLSSETDSDDLPIPKKKPKPDVPAAKKPEADESTDGSDSSLPIAPLGPIALGKMKALDVETKEKSTEASYLRNRPAAASMLGLFTDPLVPGSDPALSDYPVVEEAVDSTDRIRSDALLVSGQVEDEGEEDDQPSNQPDWDLTRARSQFQCEECRQWFKAESDLSKHTCKGNPETDFECPHCLQFFTTDTQSTTHQKNCPAHPSELDDKVRYQCAQCKRWIVDAKAPLGQHVRNCKGVEPFKAYRCPTCHLPHENPGAQRKHSNNGCPAHHPKAALFFEKFICDMDFDIFENLKDLRAHQEKAHADKATGPWSCLFCEKEFANRTHRDQHIQSAHPQEDLSKIPSAIRPGAVYLREGGVIRQSAENPGDEKDSPRCNACNEEFEDTKSRDQHSAKCKNFRCRTCGKGPYDRVSNRRYHEQTCNACPYCKTTFIRGPNGLAARMLHMQTCTARDPKTPSAPSMARVENEYETALAEAEHQFEELCEEDAAYAELDEEDRAAMVRTILEESLKETVRQVKATTGELKPGDVKSIRRRSTEAKRNFKTGPETTFKEIRLEQVGQLIGELMAEVANLTTADVREDINEALGAYNLDTTTAWLDAITIEIRRIPWFTLEGRRITDHRTFVQNGRGSVYPDVDVGEYMENQLALREQRMQLGPQKGETAEQSDKFHGPAIAEYLKTHGEPNPVVIVVMRFSNPKARNQVVQGHLANHLVARDYYNFNQGTPQQLPPPSAYHSIVINGMPATEEIATLVVQNRTRPELRHLVRILDDIERQRPRPPVRFIIRGVCGLTVAPHRWLRLTHWGNLDIEIAFALRQAFWRAVQPDPGRPPLAIQVNGPSALNFWYTNRFQVGPLLAADPIWNPAHHNLAALQINVWQLQDYNARNDHIYGEADIAFFLVIRGHDRNEFW